MTYNPLLQYLKSQIVRTSKPSLLTITTTNNTPNHLIEHNYLYLANMHY